MNTKSVRRLRLADNRVVIVTTFAPAFWPDYHDRALVLSLAGGFTVTLPAANGTGLFLRFFVGITAVAAPYIIKVANATDVMNGLIVAATDNATTTNNVWSAAATDDTITLDGSTRGGIIGDRIDLLDMKAGFWQVTGWVASTGTEATPFSATVS